MTCGVTINHLTLNENDIGDYRTFLKLRPPLRHEDERHALVAALNAGLIDVIVSDHDPQDVETKRLPFAEAEFGAIGVETMLAAGLRLVPRATLRCPTARRHVVPAGGNPRAGGGRLAGARPPICPFRPRRALRRRPGGAAFALPQHALRRRG